MTAWALNAAPAAQAALDDPDHAHQFHCEGTWFLGLEALANDGEGRIGAGPRLGGAAVDFAAGLCRGMPALHRAQLSVIRPGYPRPRQGETDTAFGYRLKRDAAHVDGLHGVGAPKRRFLRERHGFILGIPLNDAGLQAAPLVVWDGSHEIMRAALGAVLSPHDPADWPQIDLTDCYKAARRRCFEDCPRVPLHVPVGGAFVVHRLALHGIAPWPDGLATQAPDRRIAYFRPELTGPLGDWLHLP